MKFSRLALISYVFAATTISNQVMAGIDEFDLEYGGQSVRFTKSAQQIAVKPSRATMANTLDALLRGEERESKLSATGERLGGFSVLVSPEAENSGAKLDSLRTHRSVEAGTHVFYTSEDSIPFVPTGKIYLVLNQPLEGEQDAFDEGVTKLLESQSLQIVSTRQDDSQTYANKFIVRVTEASLNPLKVAKILQENSALVSVAEPELATPAKKLVFTLPTDIYLRDQWHLRNTGISRGTRLGLRAGADARVVAAWESMESLGSTNTVAIIDDGFDLTHPDFVSAGKIVTPYDFTRGNGNPIPGDGDWHGTACAGVSLGSDGGGNIIGAAPRAKFMPIRWGEDLSDSQLESWFGYAAQNGADVISCSWSAAAWNFPLSTRAQEAIHDAATSGRGGKGSVVLFAAGNENRDINAPLSRSVNGFAIHPDVIAVGGSTSLDVRATYSNFGKELSIVAPTNEVRGATGDLRGRERFGQGVLTADVVGMGGYSTTSYDYTFGGTSSATPLAAGIASLVLSAKPYLTSHQVKGVLEATARKIGGQTRFSTKYGYGCIDAEAAVRFVTSTDLTNIDTEITRLRR